MRAMRYVLYFIGFFLATVLIQWCGRNHNRQGKAQIYTGPTVIIGMCVLGLVCKEQAYFTAILGFLLADSIGKQMGWH